MKVAGLPSYKDRQIVSKEFHLKEYEALKKEVSELVEHSRKLEIYAVGGVAAFYAWWFLRANPDRTPHLLVDWKALLLPVLIVLIGGFRSWAVLGRIDDIAKYLVKLEKEFARPSLGWERTLAGEHVKVDSSGNPVPSPFWKRSPFMTSGGVFWVLMLVFTLLALGSLTKWCVFGFC